MLHHRVPTRFLSVDDVATLVRRQGLVTTLQGLMACLQEDFLRWGQFDKCPRLAAHSPSGVIELMPISDGTTYSFKYVNGHPSNGRLGLPTVMAFGILADVDTGTPQLLSELTLTTALRTAATSVLAARVLARPDSRVMALIGNGAQSEFQALAFHHLAGIHTLRLFDVDPAATARLMAHLADRGVACVVCHSAEEAAQGADIVSTVTADKRNATIVHEGMLRPGMHFNAVGGDCPGKTELAPGVLQAATVFVEYEAQTRVEGDLQQMPPDFPVTELWQVLARQAPGRTTPDQITVFDSVGFALEDFSSLRYLHDAAQRLNLGHPLPLMPAMTDPRNLYGVLARAPMRPQAHPWRDPQEHAA
jgi:ornithine cyclodeaminase